MKLFTLFGCLQTLAFILFSVPTRNASPVPASSVIDMSGEGAYEIFPGKVWQFAGPVRTVTVGDGQKLVASATAVLGTNSGTSRAAVAICYQRSNSDPPVPIVGDDHLNVTIDSLPRPYSVHGSSASIRGAFSVGFCAVNQGKEVIGNNNYVNGWILVVE